MIYHAMHREVCRELIVLEEPDRETFLTTLSEACAETGWSMQALCLMPHHFLLAGKTPETHLVAVDNEYQAIRRG